MLPARSAIVALLRGVNLLWAYQTDFAVFLMPLDSHNDSLQHCLQPVPTCTLYRKSTSSTTCVLLTFKIISSHFLLQILYHLIEIVLPAIVCPCLQPWTWTTCQTNFWRPSLSISHCLIFYEYTWFAPNGNNYSHLFVPQFTTSPFLWEMMLGKRFDAVCSHYSMSRRFPVCQGSKWNLICNTTD